MEDLTKEVKQFVLDQGMDLVGIASADRLNELTPEGYNRPKDILAECKSTIVIAFRWPAGNSSYVYIMHEGQIKAEGTPDKIRGSSEIREAYLGI